MRVVLAVPSLAREFGGPTAKALALAAGLRELGHDVALFGAHDAPVDGATALRPAWRYHNTPLPWGLGAAAGAARTADVAHVIGYRDPVGTAVALGARAGGVPCVFEPAGMMRRRLRSVPLKRAFDLTLGQLVTRGARLVVATSTLEAVELAEDGVPQDRIVVRPNGIDVTALAPLPPRGALRRELGVPDGAPLVLALGRIAFKKGLPALIEAVAALPGVHLLIAGPDDGDGTLAQLDALRERLAAQGRVHLRPEGLWGDGRARAFADADVLCMYSLTENFGAAAVEAAYCGVATIVSDQCGAAEWLDDGTCVVPVGRPDLLATALRRLTADAAERSRIAAAGRAAAVQLAWPAIARRQADLYATVLR